MTKDRCRITVLHSRQTSPVDQLYKFYQCTIFTYIQGGNFFLSLLSRKWGVTLLPCRKLSMFCEDFFLETEDCDLGGGCLICRVMLYFGKLF